MPIYFTALFSYAFGFLLWNVDNIFCSQLRSIRALPPGQASGMLLECHAWWHIFAGFGTYMGILFS
ncbi:alkaline ceramidase 3, partial [Elysia marginata]